MYYTPEVSGPDSNGGYAEYHVAKADIVAKKPTSLSHEEAAAVPLAGATAFEALVRRLAVRVGETILIHGGASGVGSFAEDAEQLVRQQFERCEAWLEAMDRAGVERRLFVEAGGDLLRPAWNPVRLNRQGTIELRGMDSNYPEVILMATALVLGAADRVRQEALTVMPDDEVCTFEADGERLRVPGFGYLGQATLRGGYRRGEESRGEGLRRLHSGVCQKSYERLVTLRRRLSDAGYTTTDADILENYFSGDERISREEGLRLVLEACDELEVQVSHLHREGEPAADAS